MQKSRLWLIIVVLLVLINIATLTFLWVQYKSPEKQGVGLATKDFVTKELELTPAQQKQYDSLRFIHRKEIMELNKKDRHLHDQLFENISVQNIDTALLDSMAYKLSLVEANKQKITLYHFREFRKILTTDQQKKFDKILSQVLKLIGRPGFPQHRMAPGQNHRPPNFGPPEGFEKMGPPDDRMEEGPRDK